MKQADLRTNDLKKIVEAFESERDKLLDQVQYLKGSAERLEWVIKVMNAQIDRIHKEEIQREQLLQQEKAALEASKARGLVGSHPSMRDRKEDLAERKNLPENEEEVSKKKPKKSEG